MKNISVERIGLFAQITLPASAVIIASSQHDPKIIQIEIDALGGLLSVLKAFEFVGIQAASVTMEKAK